MLGVKDFYIKNNNEKEKETNNSSLNEINDVYRDRFVIEPVDTIEDFYF